MSTPFIRFPGVIGNFVSTPDSPDLQVVGDLELEMSLALSNWSTGSSQVLQRKAFATGTDGWMWYIDAGGRMILLRYGKSSQSPVLGLANGVRYLLGVTWLAVSGTYEWFVDGNSVGTTVNSANPAAQSSAPLAVGAQDNGQFPIAGDVWWSQVRDGIGGSVVARMDAVDAARASVL